jgi:hypothetical protein
MFSPYAKSCVCVPSENLDTCKKFCVRPGIFLKKPDQLIDMEVVSCVLLEITDHFTNQRQSMMTICILCKSSFLAVNLKRSGQVILSGECSQPVWRLQLLLIPKKIRKNR